MMDNTVVVIVIIDHHHPHQHYDKRDAETRGKVGAQNATRLEPQVGFFITIINFFITY